MRLSETQRALLSGSVTGQVIESLDWDEDAGYWVMMLSGGGEVDLRLVAEDDE